MPKVYQSQAERQKNRIIAALGRATKGKQSELAEVWGISQQAVSYRISTGRVTLIDLAQAEKVIDTEALFDMIRR